MIGKKFNRLTVIKKAPKVGAHLRWLCKCQCGNLHEADGCKLRDNSIKSCGCLRKEMWKYTTTHGDSNSRTYKSWRSMLRRVQTRKFYSDLGMEPTWNKYEPFLRDMGIRPEGKTLDRIDNSKGYFKDNCRWATPLQQQRNTRRNNLITFKKVTKCIAEWASELGTHCPTIRARLKAGWPIEKALTTPVKKVLTKSKLKGYNN